MTLTSLRAETRIRCERLIALWIIVSNALGELTADPRVSSHIDGSIEVGLVGTVRIWFENGGDLEYDNVCVGVIVDTPGITLMGYEDNAAIPLPPEGKPRRAGVPLANYSKERASESLW